MKPVFTQLAKLDTYLNSHRMNWDDFDNRRFDLLHTQIHATRITLAMFEADIKHAIGIWDQMSLNGSAPQSGNVLQVFLTSLVSTLEEAKDTSSALVTEATHVKISASDISGSSQLYLTAIAAKQAKNQMDITWANAHMAAAQAQYKDARARLEGAGGVWTGFTTAITLGLYNRIKEQRDAAKAAVKSYNSQVSRLNQTIKNIDRQRNEVTEVNQMIKRLTTIDRNIANSLNILNQADAVIGVSAGKFKHANEQDRPRVIAVLANRGGQKMEQLRQWIS